MHFKRVLILIIFQTIKREKLRKTLSQLPRRLLIHQNFSNRSFKPLCFRQRSPINLLFMSRPKQKHSIEQIRIYIQIWIRSHMSTIPQPGMRAYQSFQFFTSWQRWFGFWKVLVKLKIQIDRVIGIPAACMRSLTCLRVHFN